MLVQVATHNWVNPQYVVVVTDFAEMNDDRFGKCGIAMIDPADEQKWIKSDWPVEKVIEQLSGKR